MLEQVYSVDDLLRRLEDLTDEANDAEARWPVRLGLVSPPATLLLKLHLRDDTTLEGELDTAADGRLSVIDPATRARSEVPGTDLRAVYQRVPNRGREWLVAAASVPVIVGLFGATARLGALGHPGAADVLRTVFQVCLFIGLPILLLHHGTRRGIGRWLTSWAPLFKA